MTFTQPQVFSTSGVSADQQQRQQDAPRGCPPAGQGTTGPVPAEGIHSDKELFAACLICHTGDYIGGKKAFFFFFPPKWVFLPPCVSLEINFRHLAAFSHDSPRFPWPGASPGTAPPPKMSASD